MPAIFCQPQYVYGPKYSNPVYRRTHKCIGQIWIKCIKYLQWLPVLTCTHFIRIGMVNNYQNVIFMKLVWKICLMGVWCDIFIKHMHKW